MSVCNRAYFCHLSDPMLEDEQARGAEANPYLIDTHARTEEDDRRITLSNGLASRNKPTIVDSTWMA